MTELGRTEQARQAINIEVVKGYSEDEIQLATLADDKDWKKVVNIKEMQHPQSWRLVRLDEAGEATDEEVVFTIYGMIKSMDLLPLKLNAKLSMPKRMKYMKQSVQLEGLDEEQFDQAIKAAGIVCDHFATEFAEGRLERWQDQYAGQGEKLFNLANRLFTPVNELAKDEKHTPLSKELDPYNITANIVQKGFAITEDNIVQYSRAVTETRGDQEVRRYENFKPEKFRVGDIVSAQLSFKVVNLAGGKLRMIVVLRSMALLKQEFNKVDFAQRNVDRKLADSTAQDHTEREQSQGSGKKGGLKRKLRAVEEDRRMETDE